VDHNLDFNTIDEYGRTVINSLDFTRMSMENFYDTVDLAEFKDKDAEVIFNHLKDRVRMIPFCDYLKRYIFLNTRMTGDYREVDIKEYQYIIVESFRENRTPASFGETSAKLSALAKNWLTQLSVSRQNIFLLGFGLNMSAADVSAFLINAARERDFNFKNPDEIIYWYSYNNRYKFPHMLKLRQQYAEMPAVSDISTISSDRTIGVKNLFRDMADDGEFLAHLALLKGDEGLQNGVTVLLWFKKLYEKSKAIVAAYFNEDELEKPVGVRKIWKPEDISDADIEKVICCGMPSDKNGNLLKLSASILNKHFSSKRFSRQRVNEILHGGALPDRFDILTLNFFIFSQDESISDNKNRFIAFVDDSNRILSECGMGELYAANPYECFLMMCIVTDGPLATYAEVWEMSFENAAALP